MNRLCIHCETNTVATGDLICDECHRSARSDHRGRGYSRSIDLDRAVAGFDRAVDRYRLALSPSRVVELKARGWL